jgi:hypothetical protein
MSNLFGYMYIYACTTALGFYYIGMYVSYTTFGICIAHSIMAICKLPNVALPVQVGVAVHVLSYITL